MDTKGVLSGGRFLEDVCRSGGVTATSSDVCLLLGVATPAAAALFPTITCGLGAWGYPQVKGTC